MSKLSGETVRPYRSHKIRACDHCRKRKSRCTLDVSGKACVMCRVSGVDCCYDESLGSPRKRARAERASSASEASTPEVSMGHIAEAARTSLGQERLDIIRDEGNRSDRSSESAHIVGPILVNDASVVEQYMLPDNRMGNTEGPYNVYSNDKEEPILYTKVSRRRPGFKSNGNAGAQQREIMEQILGQSANELIELYFDKIHPSFPILDRNSFHHPETQHTLICEIYAITLLYWDLSPVLRKYPRPDMTYAWNLAVTALQEEFLSPGLSTIYSALIDLSGRPSLWLRMNLINNGRIIALAHSLGLNRNPRSWKMSKRDQDVRVRLWWGIVIHDRWASFAHGVPPNIVRTNYNVPLPKLEDLKLTGLFPEQYRSAEVFIALCSLSDILGDILPLIYDLKMNPQKNATKGLRKLEVALDHWEDDLPDWLQSSKRKPLNPLVSGSSSLQLGLLAVKLLIRRIRLHEATGSSDHIEQLRYCRAECREGAMEIIDFVLALESNHIQEFWLPYSGYHLNSTAILLLRCGIETEDDRIKETCLSSVKRFLRFLERASKEDNWDIADVCLKQCKSTMIQMASSSHPSGEISSHPHLEATVVENNENFENSDLVEMSWLDDTMTDGFEFGIGDLWDSVGSVSDLI